MQLYTSSARNDCNAMRAAGPDMPEICLPLERKTRFVLLWIEKRTRRAEILVQLSWTDRGSEIVRPPSSRPKHFHASTRGQCFFFPSFLRSPTHLRSSAPNCEVPALLNGSSCSNKIDCLPIVSRINEHGKAMAAAVETARVDAAHREQVREEATEVRPMLLRRLQFRLTSGRARALTWNSAIKPKP